MKVDGGGQLLIKTFYSKNATVKCEFPNSIYWHQKRICEKTETFSHAVFCKKLLINFTKIYRKTPTSESLNKALTTL